MFAIIGVKVLKHAFFTASFNTNKDILPFKEIFTVFKVKKIHDKVNQTFLCKKICASPHSNTCACM